jgi:hypothetical protein
MPKAKRRIAVVKRTQLPANRLVRESQQREKHQQVAHGADD